MLVTEKSMISALATFLKHNVPFHQVPHYPVNEEFYRFLYHEFFYLIVLTISITIIDTSKHSFYQELNFVKSFAFKISNERYRNGNTSQS